MYVSLCYLCPCNELYNNALMRYAIERNFCFAVSLMFLAQHLEVLIVSRM